MEACPLNGQCQIGEVVYQGTLSSNQPNYVKKIILELHKGHLHYQNLSFRNKFYKNDRTFEESLANQDGELHPRNNM